MPVKLVDAVELSGFRGIRGYREPVKLSSFTVLIGRNNSGKTTILEALFMLNKYDLTSKVPPLDRAWSEVIMSLHGGGSSLVYGYRVIGYIRGWYTIRRLA